MKARREQSGRRTKKGRPQWPGQRRRAKTISGGWTDGCPCALALADETDGRVAGWLLCSRLSGHGVGSLAALA